MAKMICTACGTVAEPKRITKGSTLIELFLWLCLLVPGLLYSLWRLTTKYNACPGCKSAQIVPVDSPIGKKMAAELHPGQDFTPGAQLLGRKLGAMFAKK
jgi:hypothetical protein